MVGARLFTAARGPGHALVRGFGPRLGLTAARQARAVGLIERRGEVRAVVDESAAPGPALGRG